MKHTYFAAITLALLIHCGCKQQTANTDPVATATADTTRGENEPFVFEPQAYEASAEQLLAARLEPAEAAEGWVRLFDGHTLFGWEMAGQVNWHVEDQSLVADKGEQGLICTSTTWQDFEVTAEFNATETTNSGIFVRTPLEPMDPKIDCYEINIAPDSNAFPTGSLVGRQKVDAEKAGKQTPGQWRRMTIRAQGNEITVMLGTEIVCQYTDTVPVPARRIGLQHNSGRIAFRDIRIRPLGLKSTLDPELSQWTKYPEMPGSFSVNEDGELHVQGGRTQLETKERYGDFVLLADYKMPDPKINSGIFFRCIPGDEMMGYECQVSNEIKDGNPLTPVDHGTGGIFKRQTARVVAGNPDDWSTVLLMANGDHIAAWVGGVHVSDWQDTREPHENPRKGKRTEPGTIMIQGHDPTTDVLFRQIMIAPITVPTLDATDDSTNDESK
ncbi:3-keto-disaccharide hydrolase [Stieleria varia]|uniref:3-keto-alpha-glucoside-1,2-lyase/3-keto-2-hydroxy-glucal hydratase domain-containing protein n=1 Tax=Stieleria varia TaxID=2528005 RepID=A0A5C6AN55_9BACT|nr:DUF1080 domain-containing protein [Stieleria varia]TWU00841.1 hypothetical protein Pla52n_42100 [Stieleria varia]